MEYTAWSADPGLHDRSAGVSIRRMPPPPPESAPEDDRPVRRGLAVWLATGFGVGFVPVAPGTAGAALGVLLAWGLDRLGLAFEMPIVLGLCAIGVPICTRAARDLGGRKDPGSIVLDEIASVPITFFLVPLDSLAVVVAGFALHRLFDVTKPPPTRAIERLPEGLGIMADDWMAGVYSNIALHLLIWLIPAGWFSA